MNCDEVFDQLTDPGRGMTRDLKWHMDRCPRCRQLHEVLKPALSLFEGGDPPREPGGEIAAISHERLLPGQDAVRLAERSAASLAKRRRPHLWESRRRRWLLGAACACGLLAGSILTLGAVALLGDEGTFAGEATVAAVGDNCTWRSPESQEGSPPRTVILSCVACHLSDSLK